VSENVDFHFIKQLLFKIDKLQGVKGMPFPNKKIIKLPIY